MINISKRHKEIIGLIIMIFSLLSIASLIGHDASVNPYGSSLKEQSEAFLARFGVWVSYFHFKYLGYLSIVFPLALFFYGFIVFSNKNLNEYIKLLFYTLLTGILFSIIFGYLGDIFKIVLFEKYLMGVIGHFLYAFISHHLGIWGTGIFLLFIIVIIITDILKISIYEFFLHIYKFFKNFLKDFIQFLSFLKSKIFNLRKKENNVLVENEVQGVDFNNNKIEDYKEKVEVEKNDNNQISNNNEPNNIEVNIADESTDDELTIEEEKEVEEGDLDYTQVKNSKYFQYKLPLLEFLDDPIEIVEHNQDELTEKGKQLKYALNTYSVDGEVVKVSPGPVISLFEVVPAEGVRVNKFVNLSDDLARVMKAQRVRIIAPIPGSRSVGIELPNEKTSIVYLKSILNSQKYITSTSKLTIALGKTTTGDAYVFDLCRMPHLLVAGATGSGKSVCINTIIISILYKAKPDEVKFILMDPKKLELSTYKSLVGYHLITAPNLDEYVMTTAENSLSILNSAISEMERRFQVFSDARVRNIDEYHTKQKNNNDLEKIPYIVVLIDELADLMMTSGRAVEEPITRLAQKARAVGIHLVLATQRPSVDVITGLIKSNFPSRISFQVSSKVDSRTILDQMGAEKLLGKGDMLFLLPGSASPIRLHNAYITLDEIEKIMDHISKQPKPDEIKLPEVIKAQSDSSFNISEDQDELLQDAAKLVVSNQQASVSLLQRKFKIGYSRAGRLIDELESLGIVSSYNGSKAREVLVEYSYLEEVFGSNE